jgi:ParB family chromosome partitioning protein
LSRCGKDTVLAEIWPCKEWEAILRVLIRTQERKWQALEQALMIRELTERHNLSQVEIAQLMGRHQSWVSRRLCLLDALSEDIVELVQKGCISSWAAARVLAPMARAIPEHAKILADNLVKEPISTRDLMDLFRHYQKANRKQRERMVNQPSLCLKALRLREQEQQGLSLKNGPEGRWLKDIKTAAHILRRLIKDLPIVLYAGQSNLDQRTLLTAFKDVKDLSLSLEKAIQGICQP